jgi:hypothetical protein
MPSTIAARRFTGSVGYLTNACMAISRNRSCVLWKPAARNASLIAVIFSPSLLQHLARHQAGSPVLGFLAEEVPNVTDCKKGFEVGYM